MTDDRDPRGDSPGGQPTGAPDGAPDANLDPWCTVPLTSGETLLFGYALQHPDTGGLAWLASTEVLELDPVACSARTRSGRLYALGRQFEPMDIGAEGEEARLAFDHLASGEFEGMARLIALERYWVTCRKMGRHLGVEPPSRRLANVQAFIRIHGEAYRQLRGERS